MGLLTEAGGQLLDEAGDGLLAESFPGYPDAELDPLLEVLLGGTWTDFTQWAIPDAEQWGQITGGQPDGAQQIQPANLATTLDNGDARFSMRNTSGPYFGDLKQNIQARVSVASVYGTYLRLEGDGPDYAYTPNATALQITGSLEVRIGLMLSDWGASVLAARYGASGTPSWLWGLQVDGTMLFTWYDSGGTAHNAVSTASVAYEPGAMGLRVTLNSSTGAVAFYTASDGIGGTWTQLGTTITGSATSVRAGDQALTAGYSAYGGALGQVHGDLYGLQLYNGIGGTLVADAAFSGQADGTTTWTDDTGCTWDTSGAAEISGRDYRLHGELPSLVPTVGTSGAPARSVATVSGRLRRMTQGNAPPTVSPMELSLMSLQGDFAPVALWTCQDTSGTTLASAIPGVGPITFSGTVPQFASSDPFGGAALPLPQVNGGVWHGVVPSYTSHGSIIVRFLCDVPSIPFGSAPIFEIVTTGTVKTVYVIAYEDGGVGLEGYNSSGTQLFNTAEQAAGTGPMWISMEGQPESGGTIQWSLITLAPGATEATGSGNQTMSGTIGEITDIYVNTASVTTFPTSMVLGMISVQSAWENMFDFVDALAAYTGELAATRFRRICAGESIGCRIIGSDAGSVAMGPQPTGSVLTILQDCVTADGGILFEPRTVVGMGMRTRASMIAQPASVTLSFTKGNLPGSFKLPDDDSILCNDVTASMAAGTSYRAQLNDGSPKSISEPPVGVGDYATTANLNVATTALLTTGAEWYVAVRSADAGRANGLTADFGISGAPITDIARLRAGDLVVVEDPPETYQSADIRQIQQGATETFGPGRRIAWDCIPSAPWDSA